jgi:hypothetical protein
MIHKLILCCVLALSLASGQAQQRKVWYTSNSGDAGILSFATVEMDGRTVTPIVRWSPVFNFGTNLNWDFANSAGIFAGWNVRNIGLITRDSVLQDDRFKRRVYMLGVPLGLKFGNMDKRFFYFGGEVGFPFHYKEKFFPDGKRKDKEKDSEWFSERATQLTTAVFAGFHFKKRFSIKAQYFINNFFNPDYTTTNAQGQQIKPYANYSANVFFITFGFDFKTKSIWESKQPPKRETML